MAVTPNSLSLSLFLSEKRNSGHVRYGGSLNVPLNILRCTVEQNHCPQVACFHSLVQVVFSRDKCTKIGFPAKLILSKRIGFLTENQFSRKTYFYTLAS